MYFTIRLDFSGLITLFLLLITFGSIVWPKPCHSLLSHQQEKCYKGFPVQLLINSFQVAFLGLGKEKLYWSTYYFLNVFCVCCGSWNLLLTCTCNWAEKWVLATASENYFQIAHIALSQWEINSHSRVLPAPVVYDTFSSWDRTMGISICFVLVRCCSCSETFEASVSYLRSWATN